jgi:hypothetical protein
MNDDAIITDVEQITPEWITSIFKRKGFLKTGKAVAVTKDESFETVYPNVHALKISFSAKEPMEPKILKVIVKITLPKKDHNKFFNKKEVEFYNKIAHEMSGTLIPLCYDAKFSEKTGQSHIILEDLSVSHNEYKMQNWPLPPEKEYYIGAVDCLAEFHTYWWDHRRFSDISKFSYFFSNFKDLQLGRDELRILSIPPEYEHESEILDRMLKFLGDRISKKRKKMLKKIFLKFPQIAYDRVSKKNLTIVNADAHIHHFFYPKDSKDAEVKVKLIDWQGWSLGIGCEDLVYMIGLWQYPDLRSIIEEELVKKYHKSLLNFGVEDYTWDDCWYDYRLCAFLNLYRSILWWYLGNRPSLWWDALERSFNTVDDLNSMELLEK